MARWLGGMAGMAGLLALAGSAQGQTTMTYSYDPLGRVVVVAYSSGTTISYCYDKAGNRNSQASGGSASTCASNAATVSDTSSSLKNGAKLAALPSATNAASGDHAATASTARASVTADGL